MRFYALLIPSRTVSDQKLTHNTISYPTPLIGHTHSACSQVTILCMPLYVICPLPPPTQSSTWIVPQHVNSRVDALARMHTRTCIDMQSYANFDSHAATVLTRHCSSTLMPATTPFISSSILTHLTHHTRIRLLSRDHLIKRYHDKQERAVGRHAHHLGRCR
jgi:hypothetical protein